MIIFWLVLVIIWLATWRALCRRRACNWRSEQCMWSCGMDNYHNGRHRAWLTDERAYYYEIRSKA